MCRISTFFFTVIQFTLLIDSTKQSHIRQAITTFRSIGRTIKSPLFKTIGNTIKKPIIKTVGNTIKNSLYKFRRNKNTIKNIASSLPEKYLKVKYNFGSKSAKQLRAKGIKNFKYITPLATRIGDKLVRAPAKKNVWMKSSAFMSEKQLRPIIKRSAELMKGGEWRSLSSIISKSKPYLPFLFAVGGFNKLSQLNLVPDDDDMFLDGVRDIDLPYLGRNIFFGPEADHESTQIWLHGTGENNLAWAPIFDDEVPERERCSPFDLKKTRVRLLNAPRAPITLFDGETAPSWFDQSAYGVDETTYNIKDADISSKLVKRVIYEEIQKLKGNSKKLYLGGASSGAAMALHIGLSYEQPLGAIFGMLGFKFKETIVDEKNKDVPVFLTNGWADKKISYNAAYLTYCQDGFISRPNVKFVKNIGDHFIDIDQMGLLREFCELHKLN